MSEKPRVNIHEVFAGYSRRILHEFQEGNRASNLAFDRGLPRESAIREFFAKRLPGRYGVGEGLVIDAEGAQSEQCDVVIYDRETTPRLSSEAAMDFWPFESVYAVAQVKSTLTKTALESAVANIAAFKKLTRRTNNLAGGRGAYTLAGNLNPTMGMLIAHELEPTLTSAELQATIKSASREHQIDAYCVVTGRIGFRCTVTQPHTVVMDLANGTEFMETDHGDGALASFLLLIISIMNGLVLGEQHFYPYLKFFGTPP